MPTRRESSGSTLGAARLTRERELPCQRPLTHTCMVFGLAAVVNPHVEAHRLLREQARHKKRLAEIAGQKAVTVTTWDRGAPTDLVLPQHVP